MDLRKQSLIDQAIDDLGGKWIGDARKFNTLAKAGGVYFTYHSRSAPIPSICTYTEYEARKAERQNKPDWKDAPEWAQWLAQDCSGQWRFYTDEPQVIPSSFIVPGAFRAVVGRFIRFTSGEVIGDWRDTLEQRPNHIVEPDEKAGSMPSHSKDKVMTRIGEAFAELAKEASVEAMAIINSSPVHQCKPLFCDESKLGGLVDWYDYETMEMRKNALPGAGEVCECFDFERSEFVKVKVLDASTPRTEVAVAVMNSDSYGRVFWGCKFRPLDWDRKLQPQPEPEPSPELSFHLSNAFNELQASARLLPEDDPRRASIVSLAGGVSAVKEVM